jgi:hypothetical protein
MFWATFWEFANPSNPVSQSLWTSFRDGSSSRTVRDSVNLRILSALRSAESLKICRDFASYTRPLALRGGVNPDHLPRSFKRALRRHTKARLQEEGKGKMGSLARKIAAINNARKRSLAKTDKFPLNQTESQQLITAGNDEEDESSSHSSSDVGGRGGWMRTLENDPSDMTVLLQVEL